MDLKEALVVALVAVVTCAGCGTNLAAGGQREWPRTGAQSCGSGSIWNQAAAMCVSDR